MVTDYLRKVMERLSQLPEPVQNRYAAEIEADLDQEARRSPPEHPTGDEVVAPVYDPATDPLVSFIGSAHSGTPDLAKHHDTYLAETYADDHRDNDE